MLDILSAVLSRSEARRKGRGEDIEGEQLPGRSDRNGLLIHDNRSAPFRLLALAQQGLLGECDMLLPVGAQVSISLNGSPPVAAALRWVRGNRFGAQLSSPLSLDADLTSRRRTRPPRFRTDFQGIARYGAIAVSVRIRNISSLGCLIEAALLPRIGHVIEIELADLPPLRGRVRWTRMGKAGLMLEVPLSDDQLQQLVLAQTLS